MQVTDQVGAASQAASSQTRPAVLLPSLPAPADTSAFDFCMPDFHESWRLLLMSAQTTRCCSALVGAMLAPSCAVVVPSCTLAMSAPRNNVAPARVEYVCVQHYRFGGWFAHDGLRHELVSPGLFFCIGLLYNRYETRKCNCASG